MVRFWGPERLSLGHWSRDTSLFGYIPFLQNDLSLPGRQLGLVVAQGP